MSKMMRLLQLWLELVRVMSWFGKLPMLALELQFKPTHMCCCLMLRMSVPCCL